MPMALPAAERRKGDLLSTTIIRGKVTLLARVQVNAQVTRADPSVYSSTLDEGVRLCDSLGVPMGDDVRLQSA